MTGGLLDNRRLIGFAFLAPAVAYIVLLIGVPFVTAFANSLSDATVGNISFRCAGLRNFEPGLHAPDLHAARRNTVLLTLPLSPRCSDVRADPVHHDVAHAYRPAATERFRVRRHVGARACC